MAPDGKFYFLEVNTRLQVEHPVTELVTGIDLVRAQLLVAGGAPLPDEMLTSTPLGHAVEVRLYAEDVAAGFIPAAGTLKTLEFPDLSGIRIDTGFTSGAEVSTFYDPMLAKVIGYGANRDEACARVARALAESRIHGVSTNRDLLVGILREPEFLAGAIDTGYLERHNPSVLMTAGSHADATRIHAAVAALAGQAGRRARTSVLPGLPSGFRTLISAPQQVSFTSGDAQVDVTYRFHHGRVTVTVDGVELDVVLLHADEDLVDAEIGGVRRRFRVVRDGSAYYIDSALGATAVLEVERFPDPSSLAEAGSLVAPMPGAVVRIEVIEGTRVEAGTPIIVLEAMKMEHTVKAPADGVVASISVNTGDQVDSGQVLAVVSAEDPS